MRAVPSALRKVLRAEFPDPFCAYCLSPERLLGLPLEADHIIPLAAGGKTVIDNLCWCCRSCNAHKWHRTYARDPQTRRLVRLFNPRQQRWETHFEWTSDGTRIAGQTGTGRAAVEALQMNNELIVELRSLWLVLRCHPML